MPPSNNQYQCQECESLFPVWQGKCTNCNAWNSLLEYQETKRHKGKKGKMSILDFEKSIVIL